MKNFLALIHFIFYDFGFEDTYLYSSTLRKNFHKNSILMLFVENLFLLNKLSIVKYFQIRKQHFVAFEHLNTIYSVFPRFLSSESSSRK